MLGGVAPLTLAFGCVIAIAGPLIASFIANGRDTVHLFLVIGFALMPVTLLVNLLSAVNWARERWTIFAVVRLIPPVGTLVAALVLYATDHLTVAAMASVAVALGLLAGLPLLVNLRGLGRPRWSRAVAVEGLSFGSRAWLGTLAMLANAQVDQVIMTRAVSPAELGFYAVAVNVTTIPQSLSGAVVGCSCRALRRATRPSRRARHASCSGGGAQAGVASGRRAGQGAAGDRYRQLRR